MINRITGLVWSGNIFIDLPRDIHRPLCLLGNQGRRDAHKTSSRLKINQQGKNDPKQSKCNHPITYFSSWGLSVRIIFFSHCDLVLRGKTVIYSSKSKCSRRLFKLIVFHYWALVLIRCERCTLAWRGFTSKCQIQHLNLVEQKQLQSQGHLTNLNSNLFWRQNLFMWLDYWMKISPSFVGFRPVLFWFIP